MVNRGKQAQTIKYFFFFYFFKSQGRMSAHNWHQTTEELRPKESWVQRDRQEKMPAKNTSPHESNKNTRADYSVYCSGWQPLSTAIPLYYAIEHLELLFIWPSGSVQWVFLTGHPSSGCGVSLGRCGQNPPPALQYFFGRIHLHHDLVLMIHEQRRMCWYLVSSHFFHKPTKMSCTPI